MNNLDKKVSDFIEHHKTYPSVANRIPTPHFKFIGDDIWNKAVTALLAKKNILLVGEKSTGKNVLAENLAAYFKRPLWDISFNVNIDTASLIGADTLKNGQVEFQEGPIYQCAKYGGFGVLDEINMAKNEAMAVLHSTLDFRRSIDIPGYDKIFLDDATRFIATMNYGYAGTRDLNEALLSRFVVIEMPALSEDQLEKLILSEFPNISPDYARQFANLFIDMKKKALAGEVSTSCMDIRGFLDAISLVDNGLSVIQALEMAIVNKSFDHFERDLLTDVIKGRFTPDQKREQVFLP